MRQLPSSIPLATVFVAVVLSAAVCGAAELPATRPLEAPAGGAAENAPEAKEVALLPVEDRAPVQAALRAAGDRRGQWIAALREAPAEHRSAVAFMLANMPERDLTTLDKNFLLENVALAYEARASRPWGKEIPEEVFRDGVLPYASLNENRERWRADFARRFAPIVKDCKTASEAALALNAGIFKQVNVQYHPTKRPKPDQSPSESIAAGYASCSGLSILLVDACRAIGVPARVVGTPAWAVHKGDANGNHGGNHTWLEIWDHQWHVLGAIEVSPLDQTWFLGNAAQALAALTNAGDSDDHHIYASCARKTGTTFSLVWDSSIHYVNAEDVTAAYAGRTPVKVDLESADPSAHPKAHVTLRQQGRLVADLDVDGTTQLILSAGQKYDAIVSTGAHSAGFTRELTVPQGSEPRVSLRTDQPNILIILTDDQGRGDYSGFGTRDIRTPNIDRIFSGGMGFDNFYANSCVCSPSRAALMTGCYPDRVGVPGVIREEAPNDSWGYLSKDAVLLPALLKPAGYHTALVGKWHLGLSSPNLPNERGFDAFDGFLGDMMDDYWTHLRHNQNFMRHNAEPVLPQGHATDVFTEWACRYLRDRAEKSKEAGESRPFFLYLAYNAPHDPVQPKPDWLDKVRQREPQMPEKRQKLVALIEHLDSGIGQVLDTLDQTGLGKDTIVFYSSDNGGILANGANNGPWRADKGHMYEGGLRVPFAARWPGHIQPGSHADRVALTMDVFATALDVAGVKPPAGIDAATLLPTLRGEPQAETRKDFYFVRREGGPAYGGKTIEALRHGDWKLLQDTPFAPLELYNLKEDPKETTNLAKDERKTFLSLSADLRQRVQRGGQTPWQPPAK